MPVTIKDQTTIRDELLAGMAAGGLDASGVGSTNRTIAETVAQGLADSYYLLGLLLDGFFLNAAAGSVLDERVKDRLPDGRKTGTQATGLAIFARNSPAVATVTIPQGTTMATADGTVLVATTTAATIGVGGTSVNVPVQATAVGIAGNLPAGTALTVKGLGLQGVDGITVAAPGLSGGTDRETDAQLKTRYLLDLQNPRRSGSVSDYQAWALTVDGVTSATVLPRNRGAGTVDILITTSGGLPSDQLVTDTQTYIDSVKPAVDDAQVVKPTAVTVNVTLALTAATGYTVAGLTDAVTAAVRGYINGLNVGDDCLVNALISKVMTVTGVVDCSLTAPAANVPVSNTQKAICGTVGVS